MIQSIYRAIQRVLEWLKDKIDDSYSTITIKIYRKYSDEEYNKRRRNRWW